MSEAATPDDGRILNPSNANHFMWVVPAQGRRFEVRHKDQIIANTTAAVWVIEVGRRAAPPTLYVPRVDVVANLKLLNKETHCPLKGDASYFDLVGDGGIVLQSEIAWGYAKALPTAAALKEFVSFDRRFVSTTESVP